jgi:hypothetical protein
MRSGMTLPYSFAAAVCAEWRQRGDRRFHLPGSKVTTAADLRRQIVYLAGFPEAQTAARQAFNARQRADDRATRAGA